MLSAHVPVVQLEMRNCVLVCGHCLMWREVLTCSVVDGYHAAKSAIAKVCLIRRHL